MNQSQMKTDFEVELEKKEIEILKLQNQIIKMEVAAITLKYKLENSIFVKKEHKENVEDILTLAKEI